MKGGTLSVEAIFENGVLRPEQPLPLRQQERVFITVQRAKAGAAWPANVAEIYQEIAEEDRRLAEAMVPAIRETWPTSEDKP
jgi:predicted DNA-binding antitoxin AbrB/MazE fold protein